MIGRFDRRRFACLLGLGFGFLAAAGCRIHSFTPAAEDFDGFVREAMNRTGVPGLSLTILDGGRIESTRLYGVKNRATQDPVAEETVFEACSLSKPVFAYAVLSLVDEGKLDLDKPLFSYVSEAYLSQEFFREPIRDERVRRITARMVLSHRTGWPNWRNRGPLKLIAEPGEKFGYSGEGFVYLQKVIEQMTGLSCNDFVKQRVFDPLGMSHSSYVWIPEFDRQTAVPHSLFGEPGEKFKGTVARSAASLHTTSHDYALFLSAVLQGPGLSEGLRRQMFTEQTVLGPGVGWGLGLGLEKAGGREFLWHWGDNGDFKCFFLVDKDERSGFVYFSNGYFGLSLARDIAARLLGTGHPAFSSEVMSDYDLLDSPIFDVVRALSAKNGDALVQVCEKLEKEGASGKRIGESSLNGLGYGLLGQKRIDDAIKIFELNVKLYPQSANAYDSLAEALERRGDKDAAIKNYELSLKLNPKNTNAADRIQALRKKE
jgi:CubicO group peptidase (beta-lactamase class C family)